MKRIVETSITVLLIGLLTIGLPVESRAQKPAAASPAKVIPDGLTAEAVLDKSVIASGGKAAFARIRTLVQKGNVSLQGQNVEVSGTVETILKSTGKLFTRQRLSVKVQGQTRNAHTETGFDGKNGWSRDSTSGLRDLSPTECAQLKEQTNFDPSNWRQRYVKAEMIGIRKVEGKDAYALRVTPRQGKPLVLYYDRATFLMARMDMMQDTPQGIVPIEFYFSDYRSVGGIKAAHQIRNRVAQMESTITMTSVQVNTEIPDTQFAKPKS